MFNRGYKTAQQGEQPDRRLTQAIKRIEELERKVKMLECDHAERVFREFEIGPMVLYVSECKKCGKALKYYMSRDAMLSAEIEDKQAELDGMREKQSVKEKD